MVRFLGRLPIKIVEYSEYIDGAPSEGTVPAGSGPHSPIWPLCARHPNPPTPSRRRRHRRRRPPPPPPRERGANGGASI